MASFKRSHAELAICRISEEICAVNGEKCFITRGSGCLVTSKDLQQALHAKSKVFLVTSNEVIDREYVNTQLKLNTKLKFFADFLEEGSSNKFKSYELNENLFENPSDIHVVNGVTFISLTRVDKWYSFPKKSIVSTRPLAFNVKSFDTKKNKSKSANCYVLLDAIGSRNKGFIPRQYSLKYANQPNGNFFLTRKDTSEKETFVHDISRFERNEVGQGAVILNEEEQFVGVVKYQKGLLSPVNVLEIIYKDTKPLEELFEGVIVSDDASESDETTCYPQAAATDTETLPSHVDDNCSSDNPDEPLVPSAADKVKVEVNVGGAAAGGFNTHVHVAKSDVDELSPSDQVDSPSEMNSWNNESSLSNSGESKTIIEGVAPSSSAAPTAEPHEKRNLNSDELPSSDSSTDVDSLVMNSMNDGTSVIFEGKPDIKEEFTQESSTANSRTGLQPQLRKSDNDELTPNDSTSDEYPTTIICSQVSDCQRKSEKVDKHADHKQLQEPDTCGNILEDQCGQALLENANRTFITSEGASSAGSKELQLIRNTERKSGKYETNGITKINKPCSNGPGARPKVRSVSVETSSYNGHLPHSATVPDMQLSHWPRFSSNPTSTRSSGTSGYNISLPDFTMHMPAYYAQEHRSKPYHDPHKFGAGGYTIEYFTDNVYCIETMSRLLDTGYKLSLSVKYWKHLAQELEIPNEVCERLSKVSKFSQTEDFFQYLFTCKPHLEIQQFMDVLAAKGRRDVSRVLNKCVTDKKLSPREPLKILLKQTPDVLSNMAFRLDRGAFDYKDIASSLEVPSEIVKKWGRNPNHNPTRDVLVILRSKEPRTTARILKHKLKDAERPGVIELLSKLPDSTKVAEIISNVKIMETFCEQLNEKMPGTKDWRHLANSFGINCEDIAHDPEDSSQGPTEMMFDWLKCDRPESPADDVLFCIANIERCDVLEAIKEFFPVGYISRFFPQHFARDQDVDDPNNPADRLN